MLKCRECGAELSPLAERCDRCGVEVVKYCPQCGSPEQGGSLFCGACGQTFAAGEETLVEGRSELAAALGPGVRGGSATGGRVVGAPSPPAPSSLAAVVAAVVSVVLLVLLVGGITAITLRQRSEAVENVADTAANILGTSANAADDTWYLPVSGVDVELNDVSFANGGVGWIVGNDPSGDNGVILKTIDGGRTWSQQFTSDGGPFTVVALDSSTCFVGGRGISFRTTDGGETWSTESQIYAFSDAYFLDSEHGFAVGYYLAGRAEWSLIRTSDGGATWESAMSQNVPCAGDLGSGLAIDFVDGKVGWIVIVITPGVGTDRGVAVLKTTDGGESWAEAGRFDGTPTGISAVSSDAAWVAGWQGDTAGVWRTLDAGSAWDFSACSGTTRVGATMFASETRGWLVGDGVFATDDGGATWSAQVQNGPEMKGVATDGLGRVFFVGESGSIAWAGQNTASETSAANWSSLAAESVALDEGSGDTASDSTAEPVDESAVADTWSPQTSPTSEILVGVACTSADKAWAVGYNGTIVATTDGGQNWALQSGPTRADLLATSFASTTRGIAVGKQGTIISTRDGSTWRRRPAHTNEGLYGCTLFNERLGWVVGTKGMVLRTSNGGVSWRRQRAPTSKFLSAVSFRDERHGVAVGDAGTIIATANGGKRWIRRSSGVSQWLCAVDFADAEHAWAVGTKGRILASSDGGATWKKQSSGVSVNLYGVSFRDPQHGWAVGRGGTVVSTSDGGKTWSRVAVDESSDLWGVSFVNLSYGYASGDNGALIRITSSQGQ